MGSVAAVMLAEGDVTKFFENPALLLGIPLVALGVLGLLIVLSPIGLARPQPESTTVTTRAETKILHLTFRSPWPLVLAIGVVMLAAGIVLHPALIIGGALVTVGGGVGWLQESRGGGP